MNRARCNLFIGDFRKIAVEQSLPFGSPPKWKTTVEKWKIASLMPLKMVRFNSAERSTITSTPTSSH